MENEEIIVIEVEGEVIAPEDNVDYDYSWTEGGLK